MPVAPITFAHRGARSERPENTIAAFRRALELGARGLETDAWLSSDGEVVLVHDPTIRRGLRRVRVVATPAAALRELDVPRLADLYRECGAAFELSVDVKDPRAATATIDVARREGGGAPARLWLCSSSVTLLTGLRGDAAEVRLVHSPGRRGVPPPAMERHAADLAEVDLDAINLHHTDVGKGLVSLFHRFGLLVFAWDVQETRHLRAMLRAGVDGLYCDRVDRMVSVVDEWDEVRGTRDG